MAKKFLLILALIICNSCAPESENSISKLQNEILEKLASVEGSYGIAFKNLSNGDTLFLNADESFHAASTMKVPVMIELFRQAESGVFSLDDSLEVSNVFSSIVDGSPYTLNVSDDSEPTLYSKLGHRITLRELVVPMITWSSNLAANILVDKLDARNVTNTMRTLGAMNIQVLRGVEDIKAFDLGLSNTTTARDLLIIFESIANKSAASETACNQMLEILLQQHFNEIIPALLPEGVRVAHKTGSITGVRHDSGIVYLPDGTGYVIVLLSRELADEEMGVKILSEVSRIIYDFVKQQSS